MTHQPVVVAYVFPRDRVLGPDEVHGSRLTRINFAFALINDGRIVEGNSFDAQNLAVLRWSQAEEPLAQSAGLRWRRSARGSSLTWPAQLKPLHIIESVVAFVKKYELDSLDIELGVSGVEGRKTRFARRAELHAAASKNCACASRVNRRLSAGHSI